MKIDLRAYVRDVPDFPKPGVLFRDIGPLLADRAAFAAAIDAMSAFTPASGVDAIAGVESRGFILGAALASKLNVGFVAIRKAGKSPPPFLSERYALEYGEAELEMRVADGAGARVLIVDDVIATGGTLGAAFALCDRAGCEALGAIALINIKSLNGSGLERRRIDCVFAY